MTKKSSKSKSELEGQLSRTVRFLEKAGQLDIRETHCVFLLGKCGNCEISARLQNDFRVIPERRFQKVITKRDGRLMEAYQCPECGHLADAQITERLAEIGQRFIY